MADSAIDLRPRAARYRLWRVLLATAVVLAAAAAVGASTTRAAEPTLLAVWAPPDGATALSGAHVRVLQNGRALRPGNGAGAQPTSTAGTVLLSFGRLPRQFTVEVKPRQSLGGTFRAIVQNYTTGSVVFVNPVTTLVADVYAAQRQRGHAVSLARARREVYGTLGIPSWESQEDLRFTPATFDGGAYLMAARRAGGVAALDRRVVRDILNEDRDRHRFHAAVASAAVIPAVVTSIFTGLAKSAGETLLGALKHKAASSLIGWVLAAFGLNEESGGLTVEDLEPIKQQLNALAQQLTQTQGQIERAGFATLVHQTDQTIGQITYAMDQLNFLATTRADDPTKVAFTQRIIDYIGSHLLDAPQILNQHLTSPLSVSDNLIKSASRVVATRDKFFDRHSSDEVQSVYDYFAAYQAELAVLLTEYYHTLPNIYLPTTIKANLDAVERHVTNQASSLKPPVPDGVVLDTKSGLMWPQRMDGSARALSDLARIRFSSRCEDCGFELLGSATSTSLAGLPFHNWSLPDLSEYNGLVSGWSGDTAAGWLTKNARMSASLFLYSRSQFFERDRFQYLGIVREPFGPSVYHLKYHFFDLGSGRESPQLDVSWTSGFDGWSAAFQGRAGSVIYERRPAEGEQYWWR